MCGDRLRLLINSKSDLKKQRKEWNRAWFNGDEREKYVFSCRWERKTIFSTSILFIRKIEGGGLEDVERMKSQVANKWERINFSR